MQRLLHKWQKIKLKLIPIRQFYAAISRLPDEIDALHPDEGRCLGRKSDLDERLYRMYDKIESVKSQRTKPDGGRPLSCP